jgi:hypothetical protein
MDINKEFPQLEKVPIEEAICCSVLKNGFETK